MSEIYVYIAVLVLAVAFLNSNFRVSARFAMQQEQNLMVIEFLAKHSNMPKNYRRSPEGYQTFGYAVKGNIVGDEAHFSYTFPLKGQLEKTFSTKLQPVNFSEVLDQYGAHNSCLAKVDNDRYAVMTNDEDYLRTHFNNNGFYFNSLSDFGLDYHHVITISSEINHEIATFIVSELQKESNDNYLSRVEAAVSFVQYIPYGVPVFDAGEYTYKDLALPHESVAISYSDCDSKSCMLAGILLNLIPAENVILVLCKMDGGGHMITGISDLPFSGQKTYYSGKEYLLVETTTPIFLHQHESLTKYEDLKIIPLQG